MATDEYEKLWKETREIPKDITHASYLKNPYNGFYDSYKRSPALFRTAGTLSVSCDVFIRKTRIDTSILESGWGQGYAVIHRTHKYFGNSILPVYVAPDGISFAEWGYNITWEECPDIYKNEDYWIVGFHTLGYSEKTYDEAFVLAEANSLANQLNSIY